MCIFLNIKQQTLISRLYLHKIRERWPSLLSTSSVSIGPIIMPCGYNVDETNEYAFSFLMQQLDGQRLL
jgi:hypothetical protein